MDALLHLVWQMPQGPCTVDRDTHECDASTCVPLQAGDVSVCSLTGRVHVCHNDHRTCGQPIVWTVFNEGSREGMAKCRISGYTWSHYEPDPFTDIYATVESSHTQRPAQRGKRGRDTADGTQAPKMRRVVSVAFEGTDTDISRLARAYDPFAQVRRGEDARVEQTEDVSRMTRGRRYNREAEDAHVIDAICDQVLAVGPDPSVWATRRLRAEAKKTYQKLTDSLGAFIDATVLAGAQPSLVDLMATHTYFAQDMRRRDRHRRALTQEGRLDLIVSIIKRRAELLWPAVQKRRLACINKRRTDAGKPGRATNHHFSPNTVNYAFHVLEVIYRSAEGEWEVGADGTRRCILAAIPDLELIPPPERLISKIRLPNGTRIIPKAFTRTLGLLKEWTADAINCNEVQSPLVNKQFETLEEYLPHLD